MKLPTWRQVIATIVVVFVIYAVFTSPTDSANVTSNAWGHIKDGFDAITTFFDGVIDS